VFPRRAVVGRSNRSREPHLPASGAAFGASVGQVKRLLHNATPSVSQSEHCFQQGMSRAGLTRRDNEFALRPLRAHTAARVLQTRGGGTRERSRGSLLVFVFGMTLFVVLMLDRAAELLTADRDDQLRIGSFGIESVGKFLVGGEKS
jgi:hypothetical protein